MRLIKNTTELIGIKDPNIIISLVFETDTHIEVQAKLDYPVYETTFWSIHWKSDNRYNLSRWICLELIFHWLANSFLTPKSFLIDFTLSSKDSRKLSLNSFYSKTFRQTLVPHEIIEKTLVFSKEIANAYKLYQLLLFHFQEKRVD